MGEEAKAKAIEFSNHFVAFIDLLGFSEMVRHDTEATEGARLFVEKLFEAHKAIDFLVSSKKKNIRLTQFSDSIVMSLPVKKDDFIEFLAVVASFQILLLKSGLLCRGGVAYGKHFSDQSFMFSDAMIAAYKIETTQARYPRIVISSDLIELFDPIPAALSEFLLREDDGAVFVNYIGYASRNGEILEDAVRAVAGSVPKQSPPSVLEKIRWLLQYADFTLGTKLAPARFAKC